MIKINLAPVDELENQYWWLPDVVVLVAIVVFGIIGVQIYLENIQADVDRLIAEKESSDKAIAQLKPAAEESTTLQKEINELQGKLDALKRITVSKISRYKPIIVLEHLQNLRPEGLWFWELKLDMKDSIVGITGEAFDNLLIAEFISSLIATQNQEIDPADVRTQIFFKNPTLDKTTLVKGRQNFEDLGSFPEFVLWINFGENQVVEEGEEMHLTNGNEENQEMKGKG